jgi:6,7-dimethyl-8-ribityllumazine synthase
MNKITKDIMTTKKKPHILVVIADFYKHIAELQLNGAKKALEDNNVSFQILYVTGALEIPAIISFATQTKKYDGYIALGCVIRGETTHYETVCTESSRGLMNLSIKHHLAIGNGILTVENEAQALERADMTKLNKAGGAVIACLSVIQNFNILRA